MMTEHASKIEEPTEEPPVVEGPVAEEPVVEKPVVEKPVVEKKDEEEKDEEASLTAEQFSATLAELVTRARAAGLRPVQMMISSYVKQGMSVMDGLLSALEGITQKKKDQ
jgi:hypothetical protein